MVPFARSMQSTEIHRECVSGCSGMGVTTEGFGGVFFARDEDFLEWSVMVATHIFDYTKPTTLSAPS